MSTSKLRFFLPLLGIILLLGLWGLRGGEAAPPPPTTQPKAAGAPTKGGHPKMESILSQVAEAHGIQGAAAAQELAQRNGVTLSNSLVRVVIESQTGQAQGARNAVASLGGQVEGSYRDLVQAQAPLSALTSLADNPQVRFVRRPLKPMPLVVSQGVTLTNAKAWQNAGVTGSGVKAAVLDLGFYGYQALLGTELPSSVITNVFGFGGDITGGGESHGTAVAEIVHDMAPGATKYLVAAETEVDTANAVSWMCSQGVKVINYSVGWVNTGPGDGTGTLNNIVRDALNCGILWVNAAGNEGQRHWRGTFTDSNLNTWNEFSGADEGNTISHGGGWVVAALSWNDPFGASSNDFDLFLTNSGDATVCSSEGFQTGTQNPTEFIGCYVAAAGTYHIKIKKYLAISNPTPTMNLFTFYHNLEYQTAAYSLMQPADSRNGMAAGAVYWGTPTVIESFSSQGPTEDGRTKPDISAPDGTAGVTYGLSSFYGTSAASPHTAGAAALVMQSYPMSTVTQTRAFLEGRAIDLGAAGKDNVFGAGRLNLGTPISGTSSPILSVAPSSIGVTLAPGSIVTRPMTVSNIGGGTLVYTITEAAGGASAALTNEALAAQGQRIDAPTGANTSAPGIVIPKEAFAPVREAFLAGTATPAAVSTYFPATGDTYATYSGYPWWWVTGDYAQGNRTLTLTSISHIDYNLNLSYNGLTPGCGYVDLRLSVNGTAVGTFRVNPGEFSKNVSFDFASISGPTYTIRLEAVNTVASGCGSISIPNDSSVMLFSGGGGVDVPWLSESPTTGSVGTGSSQSVNVVFNSTGLTGTYTATLNIASNGGSANVPVTMVVTSASPTLSVAPSAINVSTAPGSIVTRPMTVSNIGGGTLVYTITEAAGGASAALTNEALAAQGQRIDAPAGANTSASGIVIPKEAFAPVREAFLAGTATPAAVSIYFPATGDTYATSSGYPWWWVTGDYAQGNRTLTLTSISHIDYNLNLSDNVLYPGCGYVDLRLSVNGTAVGTFRVNPGEFSKNVSFDFASISGPTYTIRLEELNTVASGCGSITIPTDSSVMLFSGGGGVDVPWLSENPTTGSVGTGSSQSVNVVFNSTGLTGTYTATLNIASNGGSANVPVTMTVTSAPILSVAPPAISVTLASNSIVTRPMTVSNIGGGTLVYTINTSTGGAAASQGTVRRQPTPKGQKGAHAQYIGPPVVLGSGGPDAFGYTWKDSDEAGGPTYSWVEISGTGTSILDDSDDDYTSVPMGFSFSFYGNNYTTIYPSSNGLLTFGSGSDEYGNIPIPDTTLPNNFIAPFWNDLRVDTSGCGSKVYYQTLGSAPNRRLVVEYFDLRTFGYGCDQNYTFQVILEESSNRILVQYQTMTGILDESTIGIENADGTVGLQVADYQPYIHDNLALEFKYGTSAPSWLQVQPTTGSVGTGSSQSVNVVFNSTGLTGTYTATLNIASNGGSANVPVTMTVTSAPVLTDFVHLLNINIISFPLNYLYVFVDTDAGKAGTLTATNFTVKENGITQTITSFSRTATETGKLDMVFVFDDTGSMGGTIDTMKSNVISLTNSIRARTADSRFGLVSFKDTDDITIDQALTSNIATFQTAVNALYAYGGADIPECDLDGIMLALSPGMGLRADAQKLFVLITDAPYHFRGDGDAYDPPSAYILSETLSALNAAGVTVLVVSPDFGHTPPVGLRTNTGEAAPASHEPYGHPWDLAAGTGGIWIDIYGGDFGRILDRIGGIVSSQYIIDYTSTNPNRDCTSRTVEVIVRDPAGTDSDTRTYTPCPVRHPFTVTPSSISDTVAISNVITTNLTILNYDVAEPPVTSTYTTTDTATWLSVSPTSLSIGPYLTKTVTVTQVTHDMTPGIHTANIFVTNGTYTVTVPVTKTVVPRNPWSPPINISETPYDYSYLPAVATGPGGKVHVVWQEYVFTTSNWDIYYRFWNGTAWSATQNLSNDTDQSERPAVAADSSGKVAVAWYSNLGNYEIYFRQFDGTSWSATENLSNNFGNSRFPAVAYEAPGRPMVAWQDDSTGGNHEIYVRRFDGTSWTTAENVSNNSDGSYYPSLATEPSGGASATPTGNVHLVWEDNALGSLDIYYRMWNGTSWSTTENVSNNISYSEYPDVSVDNSGVVHVVWDDYATYPAGYNDILYRRKSGGTWSTTENLSDNTGYSANPRIAATRSDKVHVVWLDDTTPGNYEILHRAWNGTAWVPTTNVSNNDGNSMHPDVAIGGDGSVHSVWMDSTPGNWEIFYSTMGPTGGTVNGRVDVQGRANDSGAVVNLRGSLYTATTAADGTFTFSGIPSGTYTATASLAGYLPALRTGVAASDGTTTALPDVKLLGGDADGDGDVDIFDLVLVGVNYGQSVPPADARADINGDGAVNIYDIALVGINFGTAGTSPWP